MEFSIKLLKLQQPGVFFILLYLMDNKGKEVKIHDILEFVKSCGVGQYAFYTALKNLISLNLVEDEIHYGPPKRRLLHLTEKGEKVAQKILEIKEILEEGEKFDENMVE